ncbi:19952_t:CDS:2, partial [Dentiscutata erythropus]
KDITMENLLMENLLHNDNFVSLGHVPSNNSALFIVLKGDFYVYHQDRIVSSINIDFAGRTWGYSTVETPKNFYIIDKRFSELRSRKEREIVSYKLVQDLERGKEKQQIH